MIWICTYLEHNKYILNFLFVFVAEAQALVLIMAEEIKCHSVSRGELPIYITTMENCTRHDTGITLSYWEEENKDNLIFFIYSAIAIPHSLYTSQNAIYSVHEVDIRIEMIVNI